MKNTHLIIVAILSSFISSAVAVDYNKKGSKSNINTVHPYFSVENIASPKDRSLKIGGMCFDGDTLYVATLSPDRMNKKADHNGKVLRLENVLSADGKTKVLKTSTLVNGLYEPAAIGIIGGSIYVGTKTQILRFDNITQKNLPLKPSDAVVLIDGLSTINFHTYTIGFEKFTKKGETYFCGNFTTAVQLGGKRDTMTPPNPEIHRGSNFIFGPLTGTESAEDITIEYLAGGFRTPNGVEVGPENEVYVTDNQGVFNPSNELSRIEPGSFYGHYLHTRGGRAAAFQPEHVDSKKGGAAHQKSATVHLPQGSVARSPAQPHVIRNRTDILAPYNGQILLCEFTTGSMLRVFTEQVEGVWQGVAFRHSGGVPDTDGNNGFTAGPNRIEEGPDGNYYIGQIGAGGLWEFNGTQSGLQRMRVKSEAEVDTDFNEILAVRVVDGGFEVEFLKPITPSAIDLTKIEVSQWTYIPTNKYGGAPMGSEKLKVKEVTFDSSGKRATLLIDGLKDGSQQYVLKKDGYTSDNNGWVVHVKLNPEKGDAKTLYTKEFWYTLHKKIGGSDLDASQIVTASAAEQATAKYESLCISCHVARGGVWAAPDLKGILGRTQKVIKNGKEETITVDREYLINSIVNPESEKVVKYKDAFMAQLGIKRDEAAALADYIIGLK